MRKPVSWLLVFVAVAQGVAQTAPLPGYRYGNQQPTGQEWQSPADYAQNKEQPHAYFFSFEDKKSAQKVLPEHSRYHQSLDGTWKFRWVANPDERSADFYQKSFDVSAWDDVTVPMNWNVAGIQKDGSLKYGVPIYVNQPVIFMHQVKVDDWKGGVMRTPPTHWTTYKHRNEVGAYRRDFTVPENWDGREIFINFDGVDSFFYLWVNGNYVGFSKNSRNQASFDITPYLQKGNNTVAVEVYRNSDGSFLEAQDMFRLPGIFRSVSLTAKPKVHIRDLRIIPDLDKNYKNGSLLVTADIRNLTKKKIKGYTIDYTLYSMPLYSDATTEVAGLKPVSKVADINPNSVLSDKIKIDVPTPNLWSGEAPYRYALVAELKDNKGKVVETVSAYTGFRKVEIKDTPASEDEFGLAGRYFYVNGKPVKLKGVNRHETNPMTGHVISREQMENEIFIMKRGNINHVRNSHYPPAPYWFYLSDKYGIYLEDEANIESHQYYYGDASLSHVKEFENQHVSRVMEMAHATVNSPSIVIWSLGNEAGPGVNFVTAYNALKAFDPSRPVQYERNNDIVDMGSNQYPSIAQVREEVKGTSKRKYPFHISEYAHSMGNACGNLVDYWEAIESTNFFCGAAIWDWVDQSLYHYRPDGKRYFAYGGDFGDTPNDGMFVMNGIMFADFQPKPQYYEVKKVYQYVGVKDVAVKNGLVSVFNKNYFTTLDDYQIRWSLYENGKEIENGLLSADGIAPRSSKEINIPYSKNLLKTNAEYFVKIQFLQKNDTPWAKKGFVQAEEQIQVQEATQWASLSDIAKSKTKLKISDVNGRKRIAGNDFSVEFDLATGTIYSLRYGKNSVIENGNGPKLDAFRAPVDNDNWARGAWIANGLHNLRHKANLNGVYTRGDGSVALSFDVISQAPNGAKLEGGDSGRNKIVELTDQPFGENDFKFTTNQIWTVYPDGSVELQAGIQSNKPELALARLGYEVVVPKSFKNYTYYGRGPINNYNDRKTGQFIEQHQSTVEGQFINFPKPQSMGNREDVRWTALTNDAGEGVLFTADYPMAVSALPYDAVDMLLAPHPDKLPPAGDTHLKLNLGATGLGGNSCGQGPPLISDRFFANNHAMSFIIRPLQENNFSQTAQVKSSGDMPLSVMRNSVGVVTLVSLDPGATIQYTIDGGKPQTYNAPFNLRKGGNVTAWYQKNPKIRANARYENIEKLPIFISTNSEETIYGGEVRRLIDGNPNSIWHSMFSVTVSQYPYWVDFNYNEEKTIKGFTFLPRQDASTNGTIKDFRIQVSQDGKNWGETVIEGQFADDKSLKTILFEKPVKAQYLRFNALSSQNGQDYASGAEFTIIE
ncbi:MAG: glycoside hydrolase family 2 TIM barrel-domain containing protein [Capnocytophaga sp.]|nr:glycoside hydrolase family 2 TIM barrel-domain containing protein [Capnocytophaga sp.]